MQSFASTVTTLLAALMLTFAAPTYAYAQCDDHSCQMPDENTESDFEADDIPEYDPETYVRYRLPQGRRCTVDGQTFQCFALDEYVELLQMDVDLAFYDAAYPAAQEQILNLGNQAQQLQLALDSAESQIATLEQEVARQLERWTEENRLRLEAENRPDLGSWIAWGISAAEAVAILVMAIIMGASS